MPSESNAACCIAPDSEWATGCPMRTTRFVMLAPFRGRRRSRDRRSTAEAGRSMVVAPVATRPAIAKVIASRWSSRLSVAAPRRRASPSMRRSSPTTSIRAPSARRPAAIPAIRSDSLWRSSPAPRIVGGARRARAAARHRTGISSMAAATSDGSEVDVPCSSDERTTRSAERLADVVVPRPASGRPPGARRCRRPSREAGR